MMQPYERVAGHGLARPFLLFVRPPPPWPPPEAELAKMGLTLSAAEALVTKLRAKQDAAMQNTGRGSFRLTLATPGVSHMSFSDLAVPRPPVTPRRPIEPFATWKRSAPTPGRFSTRAFAARGTLSWMPPVPTSS